MSQGSITQPDANSSIRDNFPSVSVKPRRTIRRGRGLKPATHHHLLKRVFFTLQLPYKSALFSFLALNSAASTLKIRPIIQMNFTMH